MGKTTVLTPKAAPITSGDAASAKTRPPAATSTRQRGTVPSAELVPLQFRMPPDFVKRFKQAALDRDMKLNELLNTVFTDFMKRS